MNLKKIQILTKKKWGAQSWTPHVCLKFWKNQHNDSRHCEECSAHVFLKNNATIKVGLLHCKELSFAPCSTTMKFKKFQRKGVGKRKCLCGLFDDVSPSLLNKHFLQINLKQRLDQNLVVGAKLEAQHGNNDGRKTKKKKGK